MSLTQVHMQVVSEGYSSEKDGGDLGDCKR